MASFNSTHLPPSPIVDYVKAKLTQHKWGFPMAVMITISVAIISFVLVGYTPGTHDQGIYIPVVRRLLDPTVYPGDPMLESINDNTTLIWPMTVPLFNLVGIEWGMFGLQIISFVVFLSAVFAIVFHLTQNRYAGLVAVNIFAFRKLSFLTITTYNDYFAPRFLALGLGVFSIYFLLQKRWLWGIGLLVLSCYINMVIGLPLAGAVFLTMLVGYKQVGVRRLLLNVLSFVVGLLPILIFRATSTHSGVGFGVDREWFDFVYNALYGYFDLPGVSGDVVGIGSTILGLSYLVLSPVLLNQIKVSVWARRLLTGLLGGAVLIFVVNYLLVHFWPVTVIMQLQVSRIAILFPVIFGLLYAVWVWQKFQHNLNLLIMATVWGYVGLAPLWVVSVWISGRIKQIDLQYKLIVGWAATSILVVGFTALLINSSPHLGIHLYPRMSPELAVQYWLRDNTARDARIVAPAHTNELYVPNFRVFSERTTLVVNAELGLVSVVTGLQDSVRERLDDISHGQFSATLPSRNYGTIFWALRSEYAKLTTQEFLTLSQKYDLDYVVTEAGHDLNLKKVYENEAYWVYKVK